MNKLDLIIDLGNGWQKIDGTPVKIESFSVPYLSAEAAGMSGIVGFSPERFRAAIEGHFCNEVREFNGLIMGLSFNGVMPYNFVKFTEK